MAENFVEDYKKIKFILRDYQLDASENIKDIYSRDDNQYNRFAGVVLPTGGGKSFVAIEQLLSFNNPDYINKARNGEINSTTMLYVAPSHEILSQIKMHIVKKVLLEIPNLENMPIDKINKLIQNDFRKTFDETGDFKGINYNVDMEDQISDTSSKSEKINAIVKQLDTNQITNLVQQAFPNLKFRCYAGIKEDEVLDVTDDDVVNSDFIIVDEAHRLGASEWGPNFANNLRKNPKAKILAITATPKRTDEIGRNMLAGVASMVYTDEIVTPDEYMAKEIYVVDAIKDGVVNAPDVIVCDSSLADSKQYETILKQYNKSKGETKKELEKILDQMEALIGFSPRKMTEEQILQAKEKDIKRIISQNIKNKNGKYIAFISNNESKNGEKKTPEEFFREQIDIIKKRFEGVLDENGDPVKVTVSFVSSHEIGVDDNGYPVASNYKNRKKIDNSEILKAFEDASNTTGGIKVLLSMQMLDEGVHIEGIDGALMFRNINGESSTKYLQEAGRCISSLDPDKPFSEQPKTQLIDAVGNTFKQINNGTGQKFSYRYDLERIIEIQKWIKEQNGGMLPDINAISRNGTKEDIVKTEKEARYAITLKRLKFRYSKYRKAKNLPIGYEETIQKILNAADNIDLWNINIPQRIVEPSESELSGNGFLEVMTPTQQEFMNLYDQAIQKTGIGLTDAKRISKLLHILNALKTYNKDLKFPQGISINMNNKDMPEVVSSDCESFSLEDFLKSNLQSEQVKEMLTILQDPYLMGARTRSEMYYPGEQYDLGKEIAFVRGKLWTSQYDFSKNNKSYFSDYTLSDLFEIGLIQNGIEDLKKINNMYYNFTRATTRSKTATIYGDVNKLFIDKQGRLKGTELFDRFFDMHIGLIDEFEDCSLVDGEKFVDGYDRDGYDRDGYDIFGYNRLGFNKDYIHKDTGDVYNQRGFYYNKDKKQWINRYSNSEYDALGYNVYGFNKEGFARPKGMKNGHLPFDIPKWHRRKEDGTYSKYGYYMRPVRGDFDNDISCDAHDFRGTTHGNTCDNRAYRTGRNKILTNPNGFYSYGGRRKKPKPSNSLRSKIPPLSKEDFYIDELDIDGYDEQNFKEVIVGDKIEFIHRDTSYKYNKKGCYCKIENGERIYQQAESIMYAKEVIKLMLKNGFTFEETCKIGSNMWKKDKDELLTYLDEAFEIYETSSPEAFDEDKSFKGLDKYYFSDSDSSEKRDRLNEFFEICPRAQKILIREAKENFRKLEILDKKEERGKLTDQEIDLKKNLQENQNRYNSIGFEDR